MLANHPYDVVNNVPMSKWDTVNGSTVYLVHTKHEFLAFFELLMTKKRVFCDTETTGFNMFVNDRIVGSSFGWGSTHFYIPCRHVDSVTGGRQPDQLDMDWLRPYYQEFFAQEDVEVVGQNWKFDEKFYYVDGIIVKCKRHDTRILWHLFNENAPGALKVIASGWRDDLGRWNPGIVDSSANLNEKEISAWRTDESKARKKELSKAVMAAATEMKCEPRFQGWKRNDIKKYLKEEYFKDHIYAKSAKDDIHYGFIPIQLLAPYAGVDTYLTECVFDYVMENMEWNDKLRALYANEMELSKVIMDAEIAGIRMDREYLGKMSLDYGAKIAKLHEIIQETLVPRRVIQVKQVTIDGENFESCDFRVETSDEHQARWINLASADQLSASLVAHGVDLTLRSKKTDKLLLDKKILVKAARKHKIVDSILELRKIDKIKSTYFDSILEKLQADNILHASFNQNVSTGRMSSFDPNLQNIVRGEAVRNAFIALNDDYIYVLADYSQVEVRLTAHFSGDPILVDAYRNKQDVHCRTSGQMFGVPYEEMIAAKESKDKHDPRVVELNDYRNIGKCFHPDTEVLTKTGWKRILDVSLDEEVMQAHPELGKVSLSWTKPLEIVSFKHDSEQLVHLKNESMDLRVTPDHRMLSFNVRGKHKVVIPEELNRQYYWANAGQLSSEGTWTPDSTLLQLAVATQADGCLKEYKNNITFGFSKQRKIERLSELLTRAGISFTAKVRANGATYFKLDTTGSSLIKGLLSPNKEFTWKWLDLTKELRELVLAELPLWDGHKAPNWNKFSYYNTSKQSVDVMQALAAISDRKAPCLDRTNGGYELSVRVGPLSRGGNLSTTKTAFTDEVACISVPSTFVLVRDKGKPVITGQTLNFALIYGVSAQGLSEQIPRPAMYKHLSDEQWVYKCEDFMKTYFRTHLGVKRFINKYSRLVADQGYIENYFGRIRHLPHAKATEITGDDSLFWIEQKAKRQGVNFLVQGTAGDVFKIAVVRVANILRGSRSYIISFVHDEIQMYIHKQDIHLLNPIKKAMEDFNFRVPLTVEMDYSLTSWGAKKAIKH